MRIEDYGSGVCVSAVSSNFELLNFAVESETIKFEKGTSNKKIASGTYCAQV